MISDYLKPEARRRRYLVAIMWQGQAPQALTFNKLEHAMVHAADVHGYGAVVAQVHDGITGERLVSYEVQR